MTEAPDETLTPCAPNEPGRIVGGETAGFEEYSNRPEATLEVKREKLIISDDIGYADEFGYFYVTGRDQDILLLGNGDVKKLVETCISDSWSCSRFTP